eukprot:1832109-Pyramimonas_sp.AAC.1
MEKDCLQLLACCPRHAFPPASLHALNALGHDARARQLELYARACLLRAATKSAVFQRHDQWMREEDGEDNTCIVWRHSPMARNSILVQMSTLYHQFYSIRSCPDISARSIQSWITRELLPEFPLPQAASIVYPRVRKWAAGVPARCIEA